MTSELALPRPGELLHFSQDPTIALFEPHVPATAPHQRPYVWAVDATRASDYWFPRECPRALAWLTPATAQRTAPLNVVRERREEKVRV